jgi:hypothetical protein
MALSSSTSVQGHRANFLLSFPLYMESHHFFTILILTKTIECKLEREQRCKTSRNSDNAPKHLRPTVNRVDPGLKDCEKQSGQYLVLICDESLTCHCLNSNLGHFGDSATNYPCSCGESCLRHGRQR